MTLSQDIANLEETLKLIEKDDVEAVKTMVQDKNVSIFKKIDVCTEKPRNWRFSFGF